MTTSPKRSLMRGASVSLAALLVGAALGAGGVAWTAGPAMAAPSSKPLSLPPVANQAGFADLVQKVKPAVVQIATTEMPQVSQQGPQVFPNFPPGSPFGQMFQQFFGEQNGHVYHFGNMQPQHALGSGFIIDPSGYIVTNNHVVDGAQHIKVTLTNGSSYKAKVIGRDKKTDLALLKIDAGKRLPYVAWGNSAKERVGDWVIAVGNPYGLGGTVTAGIVSANGRDINDGPYDSFLQIDAPINPGNSGGPLFDQSGQVIGIDTAIYTPNGGSVGIGFAIPSNIAKNVVAQLREHGKVQRGWIGVQIQNLTPALAKAVGVPTHEGVLVDQVEKGSPAEHAGLQQGDVITKFNGQTVKSPRDLAVKVANAERGRDATLKVYRHGHERDVTIRIGDQKKADVQASNGSGNHGLSPVGMALAPLTPQMRAQFNLSGTASGVVVARVTPGSRAADSGMRPGDIIVRVGDREVSAPSQAVDDIHKAERQKKDAIPLLVMRNGTTYYVGLELATG
jgi:serine protease Do